MLWNEWGSLTRLLKSARIAFEREKNLWETLELAAPEKAIIHIKTPPSAYTVKLEQHKAILSDETIFCSSLLVYSYALIEDCAATILAQHQKTLGGGIEQWGEFLLSLTQNSWDKVKGGKVGIVEVSVLRNAIAHGSHSYSRECVNRLKGIGFEPLPTEGQQFQITYDLLNEYRSRLKSFARCAEIRKENEYIPENDD